MKKTHFDFVRNDKACSGTGTFFDNTDMDILTKAYFSWKDMNEVNVTYGMRRLNLPELLSEGLASALFGWARTNATQISGVESSSCDLINTQTGELIQLKACSTAKDKKPGPTSFGPRTEFDTLIFMHMNCETDTANFYLLDAEDYKNWKVNRNQTIADQQAEGRRPRVTILPKIKEYNITPFFSYTFTR